MRVLDIPTNTPAQAQYGATGTKGALCQVSVFTVVHGAPVFCVRRDDGHRMFGLSTLFLCLHGLKDGWF